MNSLGLNSLGALARKITDWLGSLPVVIGSVVLIIAWVVWGASRHFDTDSQLTLSSVTSVIQFPFFFLLLYVQNKDSRALNLKVDELIFTEDAADNRYRRLESASDDLVETLAQEEEKCDKKKCDKKKCDKKKCDKKKCDKKKCAEEKCAEEKRWEE